MGQEVVCISNFKPLFNSSCHNPKLKCCDNKVSSTMLMCLSVLWKYGFQYCDKLIPPMGYFLLLLNDEGAFNFDAFIMESFSCFGIFTLILSNPSP